MRLIRPAAAIAISLAAQSALFGAPGFVPAAVTVGRHLQMYTSVRLTEAAPKDGLQVTLTSADPKRLLLSPGVEKAGAPSITVTVRPQGIESPEFFVHGLADSGTVAYTVSSPGWPTAEGKVTLAPSAVVILGPFKLPSFPTTPRANPIKISLHTAMLDSSLKIVEEQQIAGGQSVDVSLLNSNSASGATEASKLTISGGSSEAVTVFRPAAIGKATLTPQPPPGFHAAAEMSTVIAMVEKPGLAVADDLMLGKDLQIPGVLCLGETPPPDGLTVTLTSSDPSKLVLSTVADRLGSGSITIKLPPGELTAKYYIQGLGDSGIVTYNATAPGFRSRVGRIGLTPSGIIVAYEHYGPPDEAVVLRKSPAIDDRRFYPSIADSKTHPVNLVVWAVHLDPESGLAADISVQDLRAGVSAVVSLSSSDPSVGTVESPVTIPGGSNLAMSRFTPLKEGETRISLKTPAEFTVAKNATSVPATVKP